METFKILNATSNCPYGECDGSGMSFVVNEKTGESYGRYCRCRDEMLMQKRLNFANIPDEFKGLTVNSFRIDWYKNEVSQARAARAKKAAVNFVKNFEEFQERGKGLYFYSYVKGSGKTRLAVSIGNALMTSKKAGVKFTTTIDLLAEIKKSYDKKSEFTQSDLIEAIRGVQCLILDDIGVEKESDWVNEIFYSILDYRMTRQKVTLFTSNGKIEELKHDDRIKNRIEKMAVPIYLPDESIRSIISKKENEDLTNLLFK
ncbi:DnaA/Hda family protein [Clostridium sp. JN-9]|uniref:DnaA ATPase domain-containing protein n=1 Tax=Clostridium sp. JN-9 TaxID=2507159 RepID=UPI0013E89D00|nr:DnaA/Hda family protein [Clostridium sp. JN-9]